VPKNRLVSNCKAVAKDTIWQRWTGGNTPLTGAFVFCCLLALLTVWFTYGAPGPWVTVIGFALCLIVLGYANSRSRHVILPLILAVSAIILIAFSGGFNGPTLSAILWPALAMASTPRPTRANSRFDLIGTGTGASLGALLVVVLLSGFIDIPTYGAIKEQSGIMALGIAIALATAAMAHHRTLAANGSDPGLAQANQSRDAALLEAKRARDENRERAHFMAEMSHEIRTPLNAILGFADTMRAQVFGPLPKPYSDYPDLIHTSGSHLLDMVSDLLDLSKIEAGRYEANLKTLSLDAFAGEGVALSSGDARALGVGLRKDGHDEVSVVCDQRALRQMIFNLVSNAIKFTPAGGQVIIRVVANRQLGLGQLTVEDNGVGMTPDVLSRIGQPWNQVSDAAAAAGTQRARSSGLGLALVKRLAELQGGSLQISSTLGVGTKAIVSLPLAPATPPV
jgi:signal transduction histidine kinase